MRESRARVFLIGAAIVWAATCDLGGEGEQGEIDPATGVRPGPGAEAKPGDNPLQTIPGFLTIGHEVRAFRPCGSEEALWVIDSTGVLGDLHREFAPGLDPYEEVFAVVGGITVPPPGDGFGADYPGALVVKEVLYAAGEGFRCDYDWSRANYRAYGNEPFWSADISARGIELQRLGEGARSWNRLQEESVGNEVRFTGQGPEGTSIEVTLLREPCRDSMSGAYFGLVAAVRIGAEELRGCALRGGDPG
ncbi:MAG: hypothetical protein MUO50_00640 [Longimicrobiales bacterium]|nr:hypothetical protein [Longimicrobiales bacterium]